MPRHPYTELWDYTFLRSGFMMLSDAKIGGKYIVSGIYSGNDMRRRILDIGITVGSKIESLFASPFGEPVAYLIRGAVIALRREESEKIAVEPINSGDYNEKKC